MEQIKQYPDEDMDIEEYRNLQHTIRRYDVVSYALTGIFLAGLLVGIAILIATLALQIYLPAVTGYITASIAILLSSSLWFWSMHWCWRGRIATLYERLERLGRRLELPVRPRARWPRTATKSLCVAISVLTVIYIVAVAGAVTRTPVAEPPSATPTTLESTVTMTPTRAPDGQQRPDWTCFGGVAIVAAVLVAAVSTLALAARGPFSALADERIRVEFVQRLTVTATVTVSVTLAISLAVKFTFDLVPELKLPFVRTPAPCVTETAVPPACTPVVVICDCEPECRPVIYPPTCAPPATCVACPACPTCPTCPTCPPCPAPCCITSPTPVCPPCVTPAPPTPLRTEDDP